MGFQEILWGKIREKQEEKWRFEMEVIHSAIIHHLGQIGKMKGMNKWVPHELRDILMLKSMEITLFVRRNKSDSFLSLIDFTYIYSV